MEKTIGEYVFSVVYGVVNQEDHDNIIVSMEAAQEKIRKTLIQIEQLSEHLMDLLDGRSLILQFQPVLIEFQSHLNRISSWSMQYKKMLQDKINAVAKVSSMIDRVSRWLIYKEKHWGSGIFSVDLKILLALDQKTEEFLQIEHRSLLILKSIQREHNELAQLLETALLELKIVTSK